MGTLAPPAPDHLKKSAKVVVVMVPFPAQGHLNQLLHLSRLISAAGLPVHYLTTISHSRQAKLRVHGWDPLTVKNVHFHELFIPPFSSPPPNPNNNENFPTHLQPVFNASILLRQPISDILRTLSYQFKRVVIIHDSLMSYVVQDFSSLPNAESYSFHSVSACTLFFFMWERMGKPFGIDPESEFLKGLPSIDGCFSSEFIKFVNSQHEFTTLSAGKIYNTSHVIEKPFIEFLAREEIGKGKKQFALGPFNPIIVQTTKQQNCFSRHKSLIWLDKQGPNSVLYISFGTTTSFSHDQIKEIAKGLEKSEQKFIWVAREADRGDIFKTQEEDSVKMVFPEEFETRVLKAGNGMILRDWAPQLEILRHPATGGFLSHCGWNSCMESISMGVPIVAWPVHSDQPRNAFLVSKILEIGLVVRDWGKRKELVTWDMVKKSVKRLMASKEGDQIRRRAAELGDNLRQSVVAEGGTGKIQFESFFNHITRNNLN
ncbi:zeatin O-glucosyltransferase-like [Impatiens glandulifera]|uniref:zeatin O-glucosyltransferase-like n=1 Tax=Impatiens glandulifera TaxID=253017 RepID=UPI001FB0AFD3|nr:zeatin O-glucosyltransferase-like [Impatiens glandulifera]